MKKYVVAICVLIGALAAAGYLFDLDIEALIEGTLNYLGEILDGPE